MSINLFVVVDGRRIFIEVQSSSLSFHVVVHSLSLQH